MTKPIAVSPHIEPFQQLLNPESMADLIRLSLKRPLADGRLLLVESVRVTQPRMDEIRARASGATLYAWVECEVSLARQDGGPNAHGNLEFRLPVMTRQGNFLMRGLDYVPILQIVPRPGVAFRESTTPSGLARVVRADIIPESGSWIRMIIRRDLSLAHTPERDEDVDASLLFVERVDAPAAAPRKVGQVSQSVRTTLREVLHHGEERWPQALRTCYLGEEGRTRLNEAVRRLRGASPIDGGPSLQPADLRAIYECLLQISASNEDLVKTGLLECPGDLSTVRALSIADQIRIRLGAALGAALAEIDEMLMAAREEAETKETTNTMAEPLENGALRLLSRFAQAAMSPAFPIVQVPGLGRRVRSAFGDRRLLQLLDETNPIADLSHHRKVTRHGPGGINAPHGAIAFRDLHESHKGVLCPFETPESEHIGLNLHLARGASLVGNTLCHSAAVDVGEPWLGWAASLIPFLPHNDAARILMAAKNMKQAVPLLAPEPPLVQTGLEDRVAELAGAAIRSKVGGRVTEVKVDSRLNSTTVSIEYLGARGRRQKDTASYPLPRPTATGTPTGLSVLVRPGDEIHPGHLIAEHPATKGGSLALGRNLRVAYMPYLGLNFEDGIVVSESTATGLTSRHLSRVVIELEPDEILTGSPEPSKTPGADLRGGGGDSDDLDRSGVIKVGARVSVGDELVRHYKLSGRIRRTRSIGKIASLKWRGETWACEQRVRRARPGEIGVVTRVRVERPSGVKSRIEIWFAIERPLRVGDKLMGRHGNKGVVAAILPDDRMPFIPDVGPVDAVLNPIGALRRMNLGQFIETHIGWILRHADKCTTDSMPKCWGPTKSVDRDQLRKWLASCGSLEKNGKTRVRIGADGHLTRLPVIVGYQYFMKLNHLADEKLSFRTVGAVGAHGAYGKMTHQPVRGRKVGGGQRLGEMEVWALEAWSLPHLMQQFLGAKSDVLCTRDALRGIVDLESTEAPAADLRARLSESWRIFFSFLVAAGIHPSVLVREDGSELRPCNWLSDEPDPLVSQIERIDMSILDEEQLVKLAREGFAEPDTATYAAAPPELREALPLVRWSGIKAHVRWVQLACGCEGAFGDVVEAKDVKGDVKGSAEEQGDGKQRWICWRHPKKKFEVTMDRTVKLLIDGGLRDPGIWGQSSGTQVASRCIGLIDLGDAGILHPITGRALRYVPVLPPNLRPGDLEWRYQRVLWALEAWRRVQDRTEEERGKALAVLQAVVADLIVGGVLEYLGSKSGFLRQRLLGKRVDLSGRAVIVPDPNLPLDQCGIPLAVGIELAGARLRQLLSTAIQGARPTAAGLAQDLILEFDEIKDEIHLNQWLTTRGIDPLRFGKRLGAARGAVLDCLRERVRLPEARSESLRGRVGSIGAPRRIRSGSVTQGLGRAIDVSRPTAERLASRLLQEAIEGWNQGGETWIAAQGLVSERLCRSLSVEKLTEVPAKIADSCREILEKSGAAVILNRAPSLHRYSMQAFTPIVREDGVIAIHPALCDRFNADFDGDTMTLHVLVGHRTRRQAMEVMRPTASLRSSASGSPLIHLVQEVVAGLGDLAVGDPAEFAGLFGGGVPVDDLGVLAERIREWACADPERVSQAMRVGFQRATSAGLSAGWLDLPVLGPASDSEGEEITKRWLAEAEKTEMHDVIPLMIRTGTLRGDPGKDSEILKFLASTRGALQKLSGGSTTSISGNFGTGLGEEDLFLSAFGARKTLADKKLVTPLAGELTRSLVWASEGIRIGSPDCGSTAGIRAIHLKHSGRTLLKLERWVQGRLIPGNVVPVEGVDDENAEILIRSPITCRLRPEGAVCQQCYGVDPGTGKLPPVGWPVGLLAATTIGERGTQLAMRTFHAGGGGATELVAGLPRVRSLLGGSRVPVPVRDAGQDWQRIAQVGVVDGEIRRAEPFCLSEIASEDDLARVVLFEMYSNYKASDVAPKHFEVVLAAMLGSGTRARGLRAAVSGRISPLEAMAFRDTTRAVRRLAGDIQRSGVGRVSLEVNAGQITLARMLGRGV